MSRYANTVLVLGGDAHQPISVELADSRPTFVGVVAYSKFSVLRIEIGDAKAVVEIQIVSELRQYLLQLDSDERRFLIEPTHMSATRPG